MDYIENIYICLAAPLIIAIICLRRTSSRRVSLFLLTGMTVCLLSSYISSFLSAVYHADSTAAIAEIAPVVEEVMKLTDGYGADCVIAAVGLGSAYEQGYKMLKRVEGRFLLFAAGYPVPEWQINPNEIHYRRIEIIGTMSGDVSDFADAAYLISHKIVDPSFSLENKLIPLKEMQRAFKEAATPDAYRVTVDLQDV